MSNVPAVNEEAARRAARRDDLRWPGVVAVIAAAIACVAVAVAAAGEPLRDADGKVARLSISPWLLAIPVVVVMLVGLFGLTRAGGMKGHHRRPRRVWLTILTVVALVVVFSLLKPERAEEPQKQTELDIAPDAPPPDRHDTAWPTWLAVAAGGLLAAGAFVGRRRAVGRAGPPVADDADDARRAIDDSLAGLAEPADPRQAVIVAYARLLDGLGAAGAGRRASEAPFEHVARVLAQLGVRPEPLRELTRLFAEARFSIHSITEHDRAAAERALAEARTDLEGVEAR